MKRLNIRWQLVAYDIIIFTVIYIFLLYLFRGFESIDSINLILHSLLSFFCVFVSRFCGNIYQQIWRYGGIQCYIRLIITDACGFIINYISYLILALVFKVMQLIPAVHLFSLFCINLLGTLAIRMLYRYVYKCGNNATAYGRFLNSLLRIFSGAQIDGGDNNNDHKIKIAIIGAGRVGVSLAEELLANRASAYIPICFIDWNADKAGRTIHNIPVLWENEATVERLRRLEIQEVVFAVPSGYDEEKKKQYDYYLNAGYKIKVYDYPHMQSAGKKRQLRTFDIEELLFRKPIVMSDPQTKAYYNDKVVLITGGGGSIGSELCRQVSTMEPKQIILLDIYENGAYDVQQEIKILYGDKVDIRIEICSITNKKALARVFGKYHPQIVINAAAHKHVPLMENNCIEAVENNVFGTKNLVEICEEYGAERFMMVSTD